MKQLTFPQQVVLIGTILASKGLSAVDYENIDNDSEVVTLRTADADHALFINRAMISEFGFAKSLFAGNIVSVTADDCQADITGYEQDGEMIAHAKDHLKVANIYNATDDEIRATMLSSTIKSSASALKEIFPDLPIVDLAKLATESANQTIASAIASVTTKRAAFVVADDLRPERKFHASKNFIAEDQLVEQIAKLRARLVNAPAVVKTQIEARIATLELSLPQASPEPKETAKQKADRLKAEEADATTANK